MSVPNLKKDLMLVVNDTISRLNGMGCDLKFNIDGKVQHVSEDVKVENIDEIPLNIEEPEYIPEAIDNITVLANIRFQSTDDIYVIEGDKCSIYVEMCNDIDGDVIVRYKTLNGLAISGEDYKNCTGELIFDNNNKLKEITIPTYADTVIDEADTETFFVQLQSTSTVNILGNRYITVNIKNKA